MQWFAILCGNNFHLYRIYEYLLNDCYIIPIKQKMHYILLVVARFLLWLIGCCAGTGAKVFLNLETSVYYNGTD